MRRLPDPSLPWPIAKAAVAEIAESEGWSNVAYRCPAGVWTIAWGETEGVSPGDVCTEEQGDRWLLEDLQERVRAVRAMCTVEPSPNELGAMVSLAYNIGLEGFRRSTVLRQHNAGNRQAAARAFALWNKARNPATGELRVLNGLTARRAREAALYLTPEPGAPRETMPQAVDAESSLGRSPIAAGGGATAAAGAVAVVAQAGQDIGVVGPVIRQARELLVDTLGVPPEWILPLMMVGVGALIVRWRLKQRREGWA